MVTRWLRVYAWVFAASGAVFVLGAGPLTAGLNLFAVVVPGARPMAGAETTLWLGLTGSMMAMVAYLCWVLAVEPADETAWRTLLLSKACSTVLVAAFALVERNPLLLIGSLTDGPIFLHLRWLRGRCRRAPRGALAPRESMLGASAYEVWFAKANDPVSGDALWVRYTLSRGPSGEEASVWWALFDRAGKTTRHGRWTEPVSALALGQAGGVFACPTGRLEPGRLRAAKDGVRWDLRWTPTTDASFRFVPAALCALGLAPTDYRTPVPAARFDGEVEIDGRRLVLKDAPGSLGHLWGREMGKRWRWMHIVLPATAPQHDDTVCEALLAEAEVAGRTITLVMVHLLYRGEHYSTPGLLRAIRWGPLPTGPDPSKWSFTSDLGPLVVEGLCSADPALTANVPYTCPSGRRLLCRNSKTGSMKLTLRFKDGRAPVGLAADGTAAIEAVERA